MIVLAHVGDVDDFRDDVATFAGIVPEVFPAWEKLPRELNAGDEVFGRRMRVLEAAGGPQPAAVGRRAVPGDCCSRCPSPRPWRGCRGPSPSATSVPVEELTAWLLERGMSRAEVVEVPASSASAAASSTSSRTDATDPVRIEFFGDEVESIRPFDVESQRSLDRWNSVTLTAALGLDEADPASFGHPVDYFPEGTWVALLEPTDLREEGRHYLGRLDDQRGLFTRRAQLRAADPLPDDRGLDPGGRLARDDLPPADREHRAVLGRADQGQGRARRRRRRRPRPDRLPQRGRGRAAGRGLLRHRAGPIGAARI